MDEVRAAARLLVASEPVDEEVSTQARSCTLQIGGQCQEKRKRVMKWNGAHPQNSVKEVFVKSLEGKLLLFSFTEEDTVLDLRNRVAVDQFVLVFQSRTLQISVKVESTGVQRGHTFYVQGALKRWMQRQGLMGEWDCTQCGATRVWAARTSCFRCGFKKDGFWVHCLGAQKHSGKSRSFCTTVLDLFVVREMGWEGLNGIKAWGVLQLVIFPPQPGPVNINNKERRNKQEEPLSGPVPLQTWKFLVMFSLAPFLFQTKVLKMSPFSSKDWFF